MRRARIGGSLSLLLCLAAAFLAVPGCAKKHEEKPPPPKYILTIEKDGKTTEQAFDLKKPEEAAALAKLVAKPEFMEQLKQGEIENIEMEKSPDILKIHWELGVWTIVVFLLLLFILKRMAWGPMMEGLHKREENILGAIESARKDREEAQRLREQFQREIDKAHEKVRDILDLARRDAQHATEEMLAKAHKDMQAERERLHREIQIAKDQAAQELWNQTAQIAMEVSAKALRQQLMLDDHRRLVDEALVELSQSGDDWRRQSAGVRA